jgi:DNA-directed RNA polymerase subunit RPC12/RpoP
MRMDSLVCLACKKEGNLEMFLPGELLKNQINWRCGHCSANHTFRFIETGEIEIQEVG